MYSKYTVGKPNSVLNGKKSGQAIVFDISSQKNLFTGIYLFLLNFTGDSPILINIRAETIQYLTLLLEL